MDTTQFFEQAVDVVGSLFSGGSRYQIEKIVTVVVYAVISGASLVWAFSGDGAANDLKASFVVGQLSEIDDQNLHLINDGNAWSTVRVVLNQKYLWTSPEVKAKSQVTLNPEDFKYYYYIPRPWGQRGGRSWRHPRSFRPARPGCCRSTRWASGRARGASTSNWAPTENQWPPKTLRRSLPKPSRNRPLRRPNNPALRSSS